MNNLYGWVFHYNHYTDLWNAIPRELYVEYWDDDKLEGVLKSSSFDTLLELVDRGDEFVKNIK